MVDLPQNGASSNGRSVGNDLVFTAEELEEFFSERVEPRGRRRIPRWARAIGLIAALAMLAGTVTVLVDGIRNFAQLHEPAEIRDHALERVGESRWGWLVSDVVVVQIADPNVGARVTSSPPDGIVQVDLRAWNKDRLDELIDHEIGHLVDFAVWGRAPAADRRGGLASEPWAECAAVSAGSRSLDSARADDVYHCFADELAIFEAEIASLTEVCRSWGTPECR